jgi:hypothetical protein
MSQYLPGRINVVFRPGVTRETAIESLESAGVPDAKAAEPFGDPVGSVRLTVQIEVGAEDEWVKRIDVLEEVEICVRTMRKGGCEPPGMPKRH